MFFIPGRLQGIIGLLSLSGEKGGDDVGPLFQNPQFSGRDNLKGMEVSFDVVVLS